MTLHSDIVRNEWLAGFQLRVGRVTADYPERPDLALQMLKDVIEHWGNGDYLFLTAAHDDDCPFAKGDVVRMKAGPVEGQEEGTTDDNG